MSFIPGSKYRAAQNGADPKLLSDEEAPFVDFRLERMNPSGLGGRVKATLGTLVLKVVLWFGIRFVPWMRIGRWLIVTRHADVEHVLNNPSQFATPFNPEMTALADGATFMLGLDGPEHLRQRRFVEDWLRDEQVGALRHFTEDCLTAAHGLLSSAPGEIDVMRDYFTRVSTHAARGLLGLQIDDPDGFADWSIALSAMVFGDPAGDRVVRELASHASWQMRGLVDRAVTQQRASAQPSRGLIGACIDDGGWSDAEIRALVMGIAIGLVPTVTLMAGNIMTWLLEQPNMMAQAQASAKDGDHERLRAILLEVGRLRPALWPGQFRLIKAPVLLPNGRTVPGDTVVLAATASALRDPRRFARPAAFRPCRDLDGDAVNLTFGAMPHACLGRMLATAQLEVMFAALLAQPDLRRANGKAGRLKKVQAFPRHLTMQFSSVARPGHHTMAMVIVPVPDGTDGTALKSRVEALGNPACVALSDALEGAAGIHFFTLNLVDTGSADAPEPVLLMELNVDGDLGPALDRIAVHAGGLLGDIFAEAGWDKGRQSLNDFWLAHVRHTTLNPLGFTGLDYNGTVGFSVADKKEQRKFADYAAQALDWVQRQRIGSGGRPMARLDAVRALILGDEAGLDFILGSTVKFSIDDAQQAALAAERAVLLREGAAFRPMLFLPSARRLPFVDHLEATKWRLFGNFLQSRDARPIWITLLVLLIAGVAWLATIFGGHGWLWVPRLVTALMVSLVLLIVTLGLVAAMLFRRLRAAEQADRPDERDADQRHVARMIAQEDAPGTLQNHVLSMSTFKAGAIRRLSFSFALWGIGIYCRWLARPGFILSMGTIHFARWYRLAGRNGAKLMFHSNYDGNWESYLEDFVMKAHLGQTASWSHGEGFPRTESLAYKGAQDGPRFKRWTRRQQLATQCWWSATPGLTLDRVRINALIQDGLARAASDSSAREWLALFGSQSRPQAAVETEEVQTIVFRGMGRRRFGLTVALQLPPDRSLAAEALLLLIGEHDNPLAHVPAVSFGDRPWGNGGNAPMAALALSAAGLVHLGIADDAAQLSGFPFAFRQGMRARWRQLVDPEQADWVVDDDQHILAHYLFATQREADDALAEIDQVLGPAGLGGALNFVQSSGPRPHPVTNDASVEFEPFGFRDGISQPALRGTLSELRADPDNLLEPGEFLLGYRAGGGHVAPGPRVARQTDAWDLLPDVTTEPDQAWPAFRRQQLSASPWRDLGRNGSFLVLRQFRQNVPGFEAFCAQTAETLRSSYPGLSSTLGVAIDSEWVAAKLVGRWKDGIALSRRPRPPRSTASDFIDRPDTSIRFGREDARGFGCPLGAHVRRANPRDSLLPDDPDAITITNRHRLLRRGRPWHSEDGSAGLTFIALCADIERQFEFIQSQWIAAKSFHGLPDEQDPLVMGHTRFSIPTHAGPVRIDIPNAYVTLEGGGYFFLPSRGALRYIAMASKSRSNA
ncbi:MAG: cytochrome P450 [Sphingopyxis sp.]|nr:cytochrome P450 [Sphingopyxis sp.]